MDSREILYKVEAACVDALSADSRTPYAMTWLKAFPDGEMKVRTEITGRPWVVQEILMEVTHTALHPNLLGGGIVMVALVLAIGIPIARAIVSKQ